MTEQVLSPGEALAPNGRPPATSSAELERLIARVAEQKRSFARLPSAKKAELLRDCAQRFFELAPEMVRLANHAKGVDPSSATAGEEWLAGAFISLRALRLFARALDDVAQYGAPRIPDGAVERRANGRVRVRLTPDESYDRVLLIGWRAYAWLLPGAKPDPVSQLQASFYRRSEPEGHLVAVLGAGNVASISVLDILYHGFVEGAVCVLKMSPVNAYLGPLYEQAFAPLIAPGYLAIVYGDREIGSQLVQHPAVDAVHVTGSIDTHDTLAFGPPGAERERRRRERDPLLRKTLTSELGNVSPVLVVPTRYSERELQSAAENVAAMVIQNGSFNCNAAKLLVTARDWPQRRALLDRIAAVLAEVPTRVAYYPGAHQRFERLVGQAGDAEVRRIGEGDARRLPWTLIQGLTPGSVSPLFRTEPFCAILSEATLPVAEPDEFIARAARFVNDEVWGTLNAMWIAPDSVQGDTSLRPLLDAATGALRYGTVGYNVWPAVGYGLGRVPWGGHPSSTLEDAQSGIGFGHNAAMLEQVEKVVLEGPLVSFPKPLYYPGHPRLLELGRAATAFESSPSWFKTARAAWLAINR